jgi:hypothetical protein
MSENEGSAWLLKAAQEADAMIQPYLPLLQDLQKLQDVRKHIDEARAGIAAVGPLPPPSPELVRAMNAGLHGLLSSSWQGDGPVPVPVANASGTAPPLPVVVSDADVTGADDREAPPVSVPSQTEVVAPLDARTIFLALLWVLAILLPLKIEQLPPDVQTIIRDYLATVGLALIIHWRVSDIRKHDD